MRSPRATYILKILYYDERRNEQTLLWFFLAFAPSALPGVVVTLTCHFQTLKAPSQGQATPRTPIIQVSSSLHGLTCSKLQVWVFFLLFFFNVAVISQTNVHCVDKTSAAIKAFQCNTNNYAASFGHFLLVNCREYGMYVDIPVNH